VCWEEKIKPGLELLEANSQIRYLLFSERMYDDPYYYNLQEEKERRVKAEGVGVGVCW